MQTIDYEYNGWCLVCIYIIILIKPSPFVNLSDIPIDEAREFSIRIEETKPYVQSAKRHSNIWSTGTIMKAFSEGSLSKRQDYIEKKSPHYGN